MAKAETLVDTFDTTTPGRWSGLGVNARIEGGRLNVDAVPAYVLVKTVEAYDLAASHYTAQIAQLPRNAGSVQGRMYLERTSDSRFVLFGFDGGNLRYEYREGGNTLNNGQASYPTGATHWRYREAGGTLFMETTADLATWTLRFSLPLGGLGSVRLGFEAGNWQNVTTPGTLGVEQVGLATPNPYPHDMLHIRTPAGMEPVSLHLRTATGHVPALP